MAQKPDGKTARTERVTFTRPAAERIAKVVRAVEGGDRDTPGIYFGSAPGAAPGKTFRVCTFTGAWSIGSSRTVTFKNQTSTPNTVSASNLFWPIPDGPLRDCAIAKEGTAWYLLVPQLYAANAATAATLTTAALEFNTLPVVALATASTNKFSVTPTTIEPITGVTLGTDSLSFTRKSVGVFFESTAVTVSVSVTTCSTAAT
jgi:hypothetical protein